MAVRRIPMSQPETKTCAICDCQEPQEITDSIIRDKPKGWVTVSADVLPHINMIVCKACFRVMFLPFLKKSA